MKIRVSDIAPQGLKVNDNIALDPLNKRMNESRANDIIFTSAPEVEILVRKTASGAEVKGSVKALYIQPCALCLKELERTASAELDFNFQRRSEQALLRARAKNFDEDHYEDDIGISYFEGDHIELEELIQESLILSLDPYYRPERDEQNNCRVCGKNCALKSLVES